MPKIDQSSLWSRSSTVQFYKPKNFVALKLAISLRWNFSLFTFFKR